MPHDAARQDDGDKLRLSHLAGRERPGVRDAGSGTAGGGHRARARPPTTPSALRIGGPALRAAADAWASGRGASLAWTCPTACGASNTGLMQTREEDAVRSSPLPFAGEEGARAAGVGRRGVRAHSARRTSADETPPAARPLILPRRLRRRGPLLLPQGEEGQAPEPLTALCSTRHRALNSCGTPHVPDACASAPERRAGQGRRGTRLLRSRSP